MGNLCAKRRLSSDKNSNRENLLTTQSHSPNHLKNSSSKSGSDFTNKKKNSRINQLRKSQVGPNEFFFSTSINLDNFEILRTLGKGSFGKVYLVKYLKDNKNYAMKILKKETIKELNQVIHTKTERKILELVNHPFLVRLQYAFQSNEKLYFVTDFMQGGELFYQLKKEGRFSEEKTRFYASQIILALEFLHKNNIIYRDLKPENVLLDREGNIKITDFGLSKTTQIGDLDKAFTICGTPEYLAPEILSGKGYDKSVDWWSLGALIYEMLNGASPFSFKKDSKIEIQNYLKTIDYPYYFSYEAKNLIEGLLKIDCEQRLGYGQVDAEEIKRHEFFSCLKWDEVFKKTIQPPFVPELENDDDLRYFDRRITSQEPKNSFINNENGDTEIVIKKNQDDHKYDKFTYIQSIDGKIAESLQSE